MVDGYSRSLCIWRGTGLTLRTPLRDLLPRWVTYRELDFT